MSSTRRPICAAVAARNALGLRCRIIGVVSAHAPAYLLCFASGTSVAAPVTTVVADGLACRVPDAASLEIIVRQVDEIVAVTDDEVMAAMKLLYVASHNAAEGAGAAALAAALQIRSRLRQHRIGLPLSGANVDSDQFARILGG